MRIRRIICWILLLLLLGLVLVTVSPLRDLLNIHWDLSNLGLPLGILGIALVLSTLFNGMNRLLQVFLIIVGASSLCWPLNLYLHSLLINFFPNEPATYITAFIILPIIFLAGVIGSIIMGIKSLFNSR